MRNPRRWRAIVVRGWFRMKHADGEMGASLTPRQSGQIARCSQESSEITHQRRGDPFGSAMPMRSFTSTGRGRARRESRPLEKAQHRMGMASRWQERGSAEGSSGEVAMCGDANFRHCMVRSEKAIALMIARHDCLCCVASGSTIAEAGARPNASASPPQAFRPALASHSPQRQTPQVHQTPHWRLRPEARPRRLHPHPSRPAD